MTGHTGRSGVLVVDKAAAMTSFAVVALVRRALSGARRVGHAGTLDPDALGVLPVLIGEATKLMPYLSDQAKEYVVTLRFGLTTDTHDLAGRVVSESPVPALSHDDLERLVRPFVGRIQQVPPMYSALHHGGRRLYELAREGRDVERAPREVVIHAITVEDVTPPSARLRVVCGKGTYIRVLAVNLGEALGSGAVVERLVRTRVGPFTLPQALPSTEIAATPATELWSRVVAPEAALAGWRAIQLDAGRTRAFLNGQTVSVTSADLEGAKLVAVHEVEGRLLGVGEIIGDSGLKPARILHADRSGPRVLPA